MPDTTHNKISDERLKRILDFDPLVAASEATGVSYKESEAVAFLGMAYAMENNALKNKALKNRRDSTYDTEAAEYIEIITELGFELVLKVPFTNDDGVELNLQFFARQDGLILVFDEFQWDIEGHVPVVNGANLYYNWKPNNIQTRWEVTSSGGFVGPNGESLVQNPNITEDQYVWSGNHDAREAIRYKIQQLEKAGTFLSRWAQPPFLWFLHYMDTKGEYDYKVINVERIAMLPEWVQEIIGEYKE